MKNFLPLLFLLYFSSTSLSQKRDNIWMLGNYGVNNMGLDFSSGSVDTFSLLRPMTFFITNASICDTTGQLLFYSNGCSVANKSHNYMPNASGLNPGDYTDETCPNGLGLEQGAIIIPMPGNSSLYYLFYESADWISHNGQTWELPVNLSYSIINMALDSGRGDITSEKNIHIIDDTISLGRISACKHANGRDWWIITHKYWTNSYYKLLITPSGIEGPYLQQIGFVHDQYDPLGQSVFSEDGTRYTYLSYDSTMEVMNFDRCTGNFSNAITITIPDSNLATLGCAFSPDGRYLYVSNNQHVFQYDTWASDIASTRTLIATYDGFISPLYAIFFMMQLAPDNKIYISTFDGTNVLHVINNPNQPGLACNLVQHQLFLPSYTATGLPNFPNYELGPLIGSACDSLPHVGINEVATKENGIIIFPNPCVSTFSIEPMSNIIKYFYIEDLLGKTVFAKTTFTKDADVSFLSPGIYIVHVVMNGGMEVQSKLSKE